MLENSYYPNCDYFSLFKFISFVSECALLQTDENVPWQEISTIKTLQPFRNYVGNLKEFGAGSSIRLQSLPSGGRKKITRGIPMEFLGTSGFTFKVDLMITAGGDILRNS